MLKGGLSLSETWIDVLVSLFLLIGTVFLLTGAIGLNRFPDVYNRIHASGKSTTLGLTSILIGATIWFSSHFGVTLRLLLVIPFIFWTASAGAHMISRAAHRVGPALAPETVRDDLAKHGGTVKERF